MTTVLDASVLIALFNADDIHHAAATRILDDAAGDDLVISSVNLAEVLVGPARTGEEEHALQALARIEIDEEALPEDAAVQLARLRARTGLRLPDCCALLAAHTSNAQAVATFDDRLAQAVRSRGLNAVSGSTARRSATRSGSARTESRTAPAQSGSGRRFSDA